MSVSYFYFSRGDAVTVNGYGDGVVVKKTSGRRPYHVKLTDGPLLRCAPGHLALITDSDRRYDVLAAHTAHASEAWDALPVGTVVSVDDKPGEWYVVIEAPKRGKLKVARLGGDAHRYLSTVPENVTPKTGALEVL